MMSHFGKRMRIGWLALALAWLQAAGVLGQLRDDGRNGSVGIGGAIAVAGEPYGVASVLIPVGRIAPEESLRVLIADDRQNVYYPAKVLEPLPLLDMPLEPPARRIGRGGLIDRLRSAVRSGQDRLQPPMGMRIQFLFTGNEPFTIHVTGDIEQEVRFTPRPSNDAQHRVMLQGWWESYVRQAKHELESGDYPSLVQTYLTGMLANRFHFPVPDLRSEDEKKGAVGRGDPLSTIHLLAGTEGLRSEMLRSAMLPPPPVVDPLVVAPAAPAWVDLLPPPVPADLPIESIAYRVPPEFFYLRFGSFKNYLWFRDLTSARGGDIFQTVTLRGFNYESNKRIERMLSTRTGVLAKIFGDSVIADIAVVGQDFYAHEGPSLGVLFEAKDIELLKASLKQERATTAQQSTAPGARLETINIQGREVSLLSSSDNSVRSYLVDRDQYVLLTTSRHMVERFLQVSDGQPSLATTPGFRFSRLLLPEQNDYSIFAYFSPEFFRELLSPKFQIELRRRLQAVNSIEMAEMATLTAGAEQAPHASIADLIAGGYLPARFQDRPDGSQTLREGERWIDSLRGARGSFLPIADVELGEVSASEAAWYREQAQYYQQHWLETDPLIVGLRRFQHAEKPEQERITLEAYVAPFGQKKYGWLSSLLAPPIQTEIQLPPDDIANLQLHMAGDGPGRIGAPNHVMFLGVKDMVPPQPHEVKGLIRTLRALQATPAYVGAWPLPGYLDRLPLGLGGGPPDLLGFSRMIIGVWRWQRGGFSVISFDRSILENCALYLRPVAALDPAQVRLKVEDLSDSRLSTWINTFWYRRGLATSRGNVLLMDALEQQLRVPSDEVVATAERLLDIKMHCPLGGTYRVIANPGTGKSMIRSDAWPDQPATELAIPPATYRTPWLNWFRGAQAHLTQLPDKLILVAQFDMEHLPPSAEVADQEPIALPSMNFDLFSLPFKWLNGDQKPSDAPKEPEQRRAF